MTLRRCRHRIRKRGKEAEVKIAEADRADSADEVDRAATRTRCAIASRRWSRRSKVRRFPSRRWSPRSRGGRSSTLQACAELSRRRNGPAPCPPLRQPQFQPLRGESKGERKPAKRASRRSAGPKGQARVDGLCISRRGGGRGGDDLSNVLSTKQIAKSSVLTRPSVTRITKRLRVTRARKSRESVPFQGPSGKARAKALRCAAPGAPISQSCEAARQLPGVRRKLRTCNRRFRRRPEGPGSWRTTTASTAAFEGRPRPGPGRISEKRARALTKGDGHGRPLVEWAAARRLRRRKPPELPEGDQPGVPRGHLHQSRRLLHQIGQARQARSVSRGCAECTDDALVYFNLGVCSTR